MIKNNILLDPYQSLKERNALYLTIFNEEFHSSTRTKKISIAILVN
jgi:hypothetical protein